MICFLSKILRYIKSQNLNKKLQTGKQVLKKKENRLTTFDEKL